MRRQSFKRFSASVCLALSMAIVLQASFLALGQTGTATVAVSPSSVTATVGQNFSVNITITGDPDPYGVYGWEFKLNWTATMLHSASATEGPFLKSGGPTFFTFNTATPGHIIVDCTLEGSVSGVNGDGTLATLTFRVDNVGQTTLDLYNATLVDGNSNPTDIPCTTVGGVATFTPSHDVAVTDVEVSPTIAPIGNQVTVNVSVADVGGYSETFNVTTYANLQPIGLQSVSLNAGSSSNLTFTWNTATFAKGDYSILASASPVPGEVDITDNNKTASTAVTLLMLGHDVAVVSVKPVKTFVGRGYNLSIGVTVGNYGIFDEIFNVTVYANTTFIGTQTISVMSGKKDSLLFTTSSSGMPYGNYTIRVTAGPVPGETQTGDNTMTEGPILITIPGDVNGDLRDDIYDAITFAVAFNSTPASPNWNPNADINGDGFADIYDAIILANNFAKSVS